MANFEQRVKQAIRMGPDIDLGKVPMVTDSDGSDIFDAVNNKLAEVGPDSAVMVEPQRYDKANGKAVSTQLQPQHDDQMVHFWGADVELADGVDQDLVNIDLDGFEIIQLNLDGNRDNNTGADCLSTESGLSGLLLGNVEFENAPVGLGFDGISDSSVKFCKTDEGGDGVDTAFKFEQCNDVICMGNTARGYATTGLELTRCNGFVVDSITATSEVGETADQGILLKGSSNCDIEGTVDADGEVTNGVKEEPFDPGGANEEACVGNDIDVSVKGVVDVGYRVDDSSLENIEVSVNGNYDGGETNQAFLLESTNGINEPNHDMTATCRNVDRITDTSRSSVNAGCNLDIYATQVTSTTTMQLAGDSVITVNLGPAMPNPAIQFDSNTAVTVKETNQRPVTDGSGQVNIDWSNDYRFTDTPIINATLEQAGQYHIDNFNTDGNGRITDVDVQITDSSGASVGPAVQVTARLLGT